MTDQFSGATHVKEYTPTPEQLERIEYAYKNKVIINQFDNSINWQWIIDKIDY